MREEGTRKGEREKEKHLVVIHHLAVAFSSFIASCCCLVAYRRPSPCCRLSPCRRPLPCRCPSPRHPLAVASLSSITSCCCVLLPIVIRCLAIIRRLAIPLPSSVA